jgi:transketolase
MNKDKKIATRQSFGEALKTLGDKNENVVVLDADLAGATKTEIFKKAHPDRFFDIGIAEGNMLGIAAGMANCRKNSLCCIICSICNR